MFCQNCGTTVSKGQAVCLNCGYQIAGTRHAAPTSDGKAVATLSVIFGSLGFYPLAFLGSIAGFILGLIGMRDKTSPYAGRAKLGLWLSVGSFVLWILLMIFFINAIIEIFNGWDPYDPNPYPYDI